MYLKAAIALLLGARDLCVELELEALLLEQALEVLAAHKQQAKRVRWRSLFLNGKRQPRTQKCEGKDFLLAR